jgi:adenine phosphoribosyltransferase
MADVDLSAALTRIPDFPEPGVIFIDLTSLMQDPDALHESIDRIADHFADAGITKVLGAEARGFIVGTPVAYRLNAGFVPARKPGKLPREVLSQEYELEYGTDTLQIHADAIGPDDVVLIVDDLVATGGTAVAQKQLVDKTGAKVAGFAFVTELSYLHPREMIAEKCGDIEVFSLVQEQK